MTRIVKLGMMSLALLCIAGLSFAQTCSPPPTCTTNQASRWNGSGWECVTLPATGSTATKPVCRVCIQFVDREGTSQLGPWACTPYGGGISDFGHDTNWEDPDGARVSIDCL